MDGRRAGSGGPDFDGQRLAVARGGAFEILDAIDPGGRVLWRMPNLGGRIAAIARDGQHLFFFTEDPLRVWQLDRGWVLRAKDDVELLPEFAQLGTGPYACGLGAGGLCAVAGREDNVWLFRGEREVGQVPLDFCESWSLQGSRLVSVLDIQGNTPCRVTVRSLDDPASPRELARIEGWDSCGLQARVFGRLLAVFDVDGRYLLADLEAGEVRVEGRFCG